MILLPHMMKQHSKSRALIGGALLFTLLSPLVVSAQTSTDGRITHANFCTAIDNISAKVATGIDEREVRYQEQRHERDVKLTDRFATRNSTREDHRLDWDTNRTEKFAKLTAKATSSTQKTAVAKFTKAVDTAVLLRRNFVDLAVAEYKKSVDTAVSARRATVNELLASLKKETTTALTKAKSDCGTGVAPKTVRDAYVASLSSARQKFHTGVKALNARHDALLPFLEIRKNKVEKAVADFKLSVENAARELKKSMTTS